MANTTGNFVDHELNLTLLHQLTTEGVQIPEAFATQQHIQKLQAGLLSGIRDITELKVKGKARSLIEDLYQRLFNRRRNQSALDFNWSADEGLKRREANFMKTLSRVTSISRHYRFTDNDLHRSQLIHES